MVHASSLCNASVYFLSFPLCECQLPPVKGNDGSLAQMGDSQEIGLFMCLEHSIIIRDRDMKNKGQGGHV